MKDYCDLFALAVEKRDLAAYRRSAAVYGRVMREHGALLYRELAPDDVARHGAPFLRLLRLRPGQTAVYAFVLFRSRAARDRVTAAAHRDPRLKRLMAARPLFDPKRFVYAGFRSFAGFGRSRR